MSQFAQCVLTVLLLMAMFGLGVSLAWFVHWLWPDQSSKTKKLPC